MIVGLVVLAVGVIIHLLGLIIAIPLGAVLAVVGAIWFLIERARRRP
jgi:membrane associated rhomboid family serine protease